MFRAYFVTTSYPRIKDRKKEIAKGHTLEECRQAFQLTNCWEYILHLINKKQLSTFEEYVFITKPNGDRVFDTKQFQKEQKEKQGLIHISEIMDEVLGGVSNES